MLIYYPLTCGDRMNSAQHSQCHDCCCPGSLRRQGPISLTTSPSYLKFDEKSFMLQLIFYLSHRCSVLHMQQQHSCVCHVKKINFYRIWIPWEISLVKRAPGHHHPWYWLCKIGLFSSYLRTDFNYLCRVNVGEWNMEIEKFLFPLKNLACKRLRRFCQTNLYTL